MIERVIALSIRYRSVVLAIAIIVAVAGIWSAWQTPLDAIPDLSETQVIVFVDWPGHVPQEIEDQITYPLSVQLQGAEGVRVVRSSSDFNFALIHVIFNDSVDIAAAHRQVGERLSSIKQQLPAGATAYLAPEAPATGQIFWYVLEGRNYDLGKLRAIQDFQVKHQLASVDGVAEVASVGGFPTELRVTVDANKLRALGVTIGQIVRELEAANVQHGGSVMHSPTAEYLIHARSVPANGENLDLPAIVASLEKLVLPVNGQAVPLRAVADIALAPGPRRGVLEQDGNEVVGGVVLMRYGHNPLDVIERLRDKIMRVQASLPDGVRIVTSYDRTPLIRAAVSTVSTALIEAMVVATLCVILVMRHIRTSLVISLTLPLSVLSSFLLMWLLRRFGIVDVQTNIMSLAGLVISIGVLVDSAIVMSENVMHTLHRQFGSRSVRGDVRPLILPACQTVGRPIFFSVVIMLLSFLPVFALGGLEGKMFRPLAFTKSFALVASAIAAVTLVPALCTWMVRGRMRGERDIWLVRSLIDAYRPVLNFLLERPAAVFWIVTVTFLFGFAPLGAWPRALSDGLGRATPLGERPLMLLALVVGLCTTTCFARRRSTAAAMFASLIVMALIAQRMQPLSSESISPFDEQVVMDMPISVPRASVSQAADDLKARDMVLCRFPEVEMVMGKAGRADTPTDPAPIDMIETMVSFRPQHFWPRRKVDPRDAERVLQRIEKHLQDEGLASAAQQENGQTTVLDETCVQAVLDRFDVLMREYAYHRHQDHIRALTRELPVDAVRLIGGGWLRAGELKAPLSDGAVAAIVSSLPTDALRQLALNPALERVDEVMRLARKEAQRQKILSASTQAARPVGIFSLFSTNNDLRERVQRRLQQRYEELWKEHTRQVDRELAERAPGTFARIALEQFLNTMEIRSRALADEFRQLTDFRNELPIASAPAAHHHGSANAASPTLDPLPLIDGLQEQFTQLARSRLGLHRCERNELVGFDGEMDRALQMPGWQNVWTMPIQNRVDMLATGINTTVGIRVLGHDLDQVVLASQRVADIVKQIPGAADVVADPIRGKSYLTIDVDRQRAANMGVVLSEANQTLAAALGGLPAGTIALGRQRHLVRIALPANMRDDPESLRRLPIPSHGPNATTGTAVDESSSTQAVAAIEHSVPLGEIADIRIEDGPATIKGENGLLRNYVRLNVRDRDALEFVAEARRVVREKADLPPGVYLEWTGQFEYQQQARHKLALVLPLVVGLILLILFLTYRDVADALLMLMAVPGAIAGGLLAQWWFGHPFTVTVAIGYIACFGMATSTGIIMLVYLRESVQRAGGIENISLPQLRQSVIDGAVQRLRPKLLTEATTIISLAPMLWATGVGAEVIRPMAAPVLGGILIADEVIDLFLPILFYWVRRRRWHRIHGMPLSSNLVNQTPLDASEPAYSPNEVSRAIADEGILK